MVEHDNVALCIFLEGNLPHWSLKSFIQGPSIIIYWIWFLDVIITIWSQHCWCYLFAYIFTWSTANNVIQPFLHGLYHQPSTLLGELSASNTYSSKLNIENVATIWFRTWDVRNSWKMEPFSSVIFLILNMHITLESMLFF